MNSLSAPNTNNETARSDRDEADSGDEASSADGADAASTSDAVAAAGDLPGPMPGRRRRFTSEEKRQFIAQAMAPGESMSSVGRRHGLSVSLLFRWRRQLDSDLDKKREGTPAQKSEARDLRERVRELERLLGRKTLEVELLQQELSRLGHNPGVALQALEAAAAAAPSAVR
jgi:transposase